MVGFAAVIGPNIGIWLNALGTLSYREKRRAEGDKSKRMF